MTNAIDYYSLIRAIHATTAITSFILLVVRTYFLLHAKYRLKSRAIKLSPHIIDTILLSSAISLVYIGGYSVNLENAWIIAKIVTLILYIFSGLYLFRLARRRKQIYITLSVSSLLYLYIILVAFTKNPFPFQAL